MEAIKQEHIDQITQIVDETVADFLKKLPEEISKGLRSATLRILGFSDTWGKWQVDTFNKGSLLSSLINDKAQTAAQEAVKKIDWTIKDTMIEALQKDFDSQFGYKLRDVINKLADQKASEIGQILCKKMQIEITPPTPKALADPKYMAHMPKIGEILMAEAVKNDKKDKK